MLGWGFYAVRIDYSQNNEVWAQIANRFIQLARSAVDDNVPDEEREEVDPRYATLYWLSDKGRFAGTTFEQCRNALTEDELQDRAFFIADTEAIASLNTKTPFLWAVETACDDAGDIMSDAISRMQLQAGAMSYHDEESYRGYFKVPLDSLFDDFMPDMSDESFGMEQLLGRYEINFS